MSENKEYVSQSLENGAIHISEDVLAAMASMAVCEVEGVYGLSNAISAKKNSGKGIRVVIAEDDTVSVDCYVVALYGYSVIEVAKAVQEAVTSTVESTTASKVANVNVSISGIAHPRTTKK